MARTKVSLLLCIPMLLIPFSSIFSQGWNVNLLGLSGNWDYTFSAKVAGNFAYVAAGVSGLIMVDISDPANPVEIGRYDTPDNAYEVAISNGYAFIADQGGVCVVDISDPSSPYQVYYLTATSTVVDLVISDSLLFFTHGTNGFTILNISDPCAPTQVGGCFTEGFARSIIVSGDYAYVGSGPSGTTEDGGLSIVDISDPSAPNLLSFYSIGGWPFVEDEYYSLALLDSIIFACRADFPNSGRLDFFDVSIPSHPYFLGYYNTSGQSYDLCLMDSFAIVANGYSGLDILNVSDLSNITEVGACETPGVARGITISDSMAYIADFSSGLQIIDVSDLINPILIGGCGIIGYYNHIAACGNYAYITCYNQNGFKTFDISLSDSIVEMGYCSIPDDPEGVAIAGNYAYIADSDSGLRIFNVADPTVPFEAGHLSAGFTNEVAVSGNLAYLAVSNGLKIANIANPANPYLISFYTTTDECFSIALSGNYAYLGCDNALRIIDISNPYSLQQCGNFSVDDLAYDVAVSGNYAYVADYDCGVEIVDISNPYTPFEVGHIYFPFTVFSVAVENDNLYILIENAGLKIYNIADPAAPELVGYYNTPGMATDLTVCGNYAFVADWYYFEILDCSATVHTKGNSTADVPFGFSLSTPFPNPFNLAANIRFSLNKSGVVKLAVYDLQGSQVSLLTNGFLKTGEYNLFWQAENYPSGIYFVKLEQEGNTAVEKVVLMK